MAYSTLSNVKEYLGVSSTNDDTLITSLLNQSIAFVDSYTENKFEPYSDTRYYSRDDVYNRSLVLDEWLQTIVTLTNADADSTVITSDKYYLLPKNYSAFSEIMMRSTEENWVFNTTDDFVSVEGTWGLFATVPDDIVFVVNRLTSYLYRQKDNHNDIDRAVAVSDAILLPQNLPRDIKDILNRYRKTF